MRSRPASQRPTAEKMTDSSPSRKRVLIVDDEPDALELLSVNLRSAGFAVLCAEDGQEALDKARKLCPDLIVLDVMIPEVDGMEVCKILRRNRDTAGIPIIMLTARAGEVDRVLGLELGADDYVTKPFSPRELALRIRNLLARRPSGSESQERFEFDELSIDIPRHRVSVGSRKVALTPIEFRLLCLLARRKGRVQSREQLLQDVWGYSSLVDSRTVDTHVRRLREKLGEAARFLDTVRGMGYRLLDD